MDMGADSLERALKASIRDSLDGLPWRTFSVSAVARHLAKEVIECSRIDEDGRAYAPDQYTLSIHPRETGELQSAPPEVQMRLALDLQEVLQNAGFIFAREPHITLATDPTLSIGDIRVIAWHSSDPLEFTKDYKEPAKEAERRPLANAFLVVEGKRHFPLNKEVVNIGRLPDNDLVLNDRHVSRRHAQLRARENGYVIVDLKSSAGTQVNRRLIKKHSLRPGDVILIAKVELIYGQDPSGPPDVTPPYAPPFKPVKDRHRVTPLDLKTVPEEETAILDSKDQNDS
ncbi:MAG: DUF2662 domain-containing protein [Anaerolineales bacterium]|nr:MAG: DUF2662 domain-containing protein [Anaerolineales bacterium]